MWPIGKFPVLRDDARDQTVPESSIIIEYLAEHYPGTSKLVPEDRDSAREVRLNDRFFDLYVHLPMQKIVTDRFRPEGKHDPFGVEQAKGQLGTALAILETKLTSNAWIMGDTFTMADCAAAPPLFYAYLAMPFEEEYKPGSRLFAPAHATAIFRTLYRGGQTLSAVLPDQGSRLELCLSSARDTNTGVEAWPMSMDSWCRCRRSSLDVYRRMARKAGKIWREHGALEFRECVADDVKVGKRTSFPRSVKLKPNETVVFSWITFKSRADRDRVNAKVMKDKRFAAMMSGKDMPFDGKRLIYGGFKVLVEV